MTTVGNANPDDPGSRIKSLRSPTPASWSPPTRDTSTCAEPQRASLLGIIPNAPALFSSGAEAIGE